MNFTDNKNRSRCVIDKLTFSIGNDTAMHGHRNTTLDNNMCGLKATLVNCTMVTLSSCYRLCRRTLCFIRDLRSMTDYNMSFQLGLYYVVYTILFSERLRAVVTLRPVSYRHTWFVEIWLFLSETSQQWFDMQWELHWERTFLYNAN